MGRRQERTGRRSPPLPIRDGLNPARIRLPAADPGTPATVAEYLRRRFATRPELTTLTDAERERLADRLDQQIAAGEVVDPDGRPIDLGTAYQEGLLLYLYRDPPVEQPIPFDLEILFRDEHLVVVDKPHFLASTPRGLYIAESALVRLRRELELPELSPLHRLDRVTAGVLAFSVRPADRGAYQTLFARREVDKEYRAVADHRPDLTFPRTVQNRLVKERGTPVAEEVPGEPNSRTDLELLGVRDDRALYRLVPHTGRTHQLRVHLSGLGIPIRFDPFYPVLTNPDPRDFSRPLQLLARRLTFTDPVTGQRRDFRSRRSLQEWPD